MLFVSSIAMADSITTVSNNAFVGVVGGGSTLGIINDADQGTDLGGNNDLPNPEPTTLLLMSLGLGAAYLRKRFKKNV